MENAIGMADSWLAGLLCRGFLELQDPAGKGALDLRIWHLAAALGKNPVGFGDLWLKAMDRPWGV